MALTDLTTYTCVLCTDGVFIFILHCILFASLGMLPYSMIVYVLTQLYSSPEISLNYCNCHTHKYCYKCNYYYLSFKLLQLLYPKPVKRSQYDP